MNTSDRTKLTAALRDHVAKIAADLRTKMSAPGATRVAAAQLHKDERVSVDFESWSDLLSRRAAVLWVLKSVYVRVLEDRGLLSPGRILDPEAQQLFERLAPNLGETAFLRWIYKDLASKDGGLPELFAPQPAEVVLPSDELSRALIAFWRHRDADTGVVWSFADEQFEGELMGDLYQELDPVVKERFALCQTPDFVRTFILDRTLTPAIETFGADEVRLLDPACGSGHFLIDGLKRLVVATADKHKEWSREKVVTHALDRVVGIDLNDYACALARTRLIMTAAELADVTKLADAARFHPHVYWADGLEQVEKEEQNPSLQFSLFEKVEEKPRATLTRSDVRSALKRVLEGKFHALVGNPPYIAEGDALRREYQREEVGPKRRRYISAHRDYSLGGPFFERLVQLATTDAFIGVITGSNFVKCQFGKPFVEKVLSAVDLTQILDCSNIEIPHHGTPTIVLLARNRRATNDKIRVILAKRFEAGADGGSDPGMAWRSATGHCNEVGYQDALVAVWDASRETLRRHPWTLGSQGASDLRQTLEQRGTPLVQVARSIGLVVMTGEDEVFIQARDVLERAGLVHLRPAVLGDQIRDWAVAPGDACVWPYDDHGERIADAEAEDIQRVLWRYRTRLRSRQVFGRSLEERGLRWWEIREFYKERLSTKYVIAFAGIATHNHFVLGESSAAYNNRTAPVVTLAPDASHDDHLALLALLNSSVACYWMKQVFQPRSHAGQKHHPSIERTAFEFVITGLKSFPVPQIEPYRAALASHAREADRAMRQRTEALSIAGWMEASFDPATLRQKLAQRWLEADRMRQTAIFHQEEIDWIAYQAYGLLQKETSAHAGGSKRIPRGQRAFERASGHVSFVREGKRQLSVEEAECETGARELPPEYEEVTRRRLAFITDDPTIGQIERYSFKRLWRDTEENVREAVFRQRHDQRQMRLWLLDRLEQAAKVRVGAYTSSRFAADLMADKRVQAVVEVLGSSDLDVLVQHLLKENGVPSCVYHLYTESGLSKRRVWEEVWASQRREDAGEAVPSHPAPPEYSQGSRGKSTDFGRLEYWKLRGALDTPRERFIAFTEVPGRSGETLYGWAGWTAQQRVKAILAIDEELEDAAVPLADRVGLLDSAWRLLPDVAREDAAAAARLKAELQALVGPEGPSGALIEDWKKRFPPPTSRAARRSSEEVETKDSLDDLPSVIPDVSDGEHAAILIWALLHAAGGTATRMDLARAFALRARPALLRRLAPSSLKREVAHWVTAVGSRSAKAGLLASTLSELAARNGVSLGTNNESRATVSASPHTPAEAQIDAWFHFEANLALKVLRAQPEEKFSVIDKALTGADRKLLEIAA